ncbi:hypothetical protein SUGI_0871130 [Cryptomeria japonica]|nr:hypothetical protein SUGI_0871130 [Cryptomeria japonica]
MSPISFYIALSSVLGIAMITDISGCKDDERSYLLDFKGGLNDSYARLSSWRGYNCCQWQGILCGYQTNHVIQLDLKNPYRKGNDLDGYKVDRPLSGEIHPSLFNLQHLRHLDLSWNDFEGIAIPHQLGSLKKLTFLSLAYAGFEGEIPLEFGNLSALQYLDLSDYYSSKFRLKSSRFGEWVRSLRNLEYLAMRNLNLEKASHNWGDSLSSLSNLSQIYLSHCSLSGSIPSLLNLIRLSHLHLIDNSFPFTLPAWFKNVSSLVSLDLSSCDLSGSIPSDFLHGSSSLRKLSLAVNNLQGEIPPSIANFSKLQTLDVVDNQLTGVIPPFGYLMEPLSSLSKIDLSFNQLKGGVPYCLGRISSLRYLVLEYNQLNGDIPTSLGQLSLLRRLVLNNNQLSGAIPDSFSELVGLENQLTINISSSWVPQFSHLGYLGLSSCNIEGNFPAFLSTQYSLRDLDLSDNRISGGVPAWLRDLTYLQKLNLSNNQLEDCLPQLNYKVFIFLDLHNNSFHGSISGLSFGGIILDLSHNKFNGSIPGTIHPLFTMSLSANNLSGRMPHSICKAGNEITILDLSDNRLRDVISADLGKCSSLIILNLARNNLQGGIPEEVLDLSHNNISRTIPRGLEMLHAMVNQSQSFEMQSYEHTVGIRINANPYIYALVDFLGQITLWIKGTARPYPKIWRSFKVMDLSHNKLWGSIPHKIGLLRGLVALNISNNTMSGSIPESLGQMVNLQSQDLSENMLSGKIPPELGTPTSEDPPLKI